MLATLRKRLPLALCMVLMVMSQSAFGSEDDNHVDLVIFSYNRPLQLYALLESTAQFVTGLGEVHVVYRASSPEYDAGYAEVFATFPSVQSHQQGSNPHADFKPLTLQSTFNSSNKYVVYAVDDIIITVPVDLAACAAALENYNGYGFYVRLGKNTTWCYPNSSFQGVPPLQEFGNGIMAWRFCDGQGDWGYPNTVDLTVYRKKDIEHDLHTMAFHSPFTFEGTWSALLGAIAGRGGLCYEHSKMVNVPLNRVGECPNKHMGFLTAPELLDIFNQGFKIDISSLVGIDNVSAHMDYTPTFIER